MLWVLAAMGISGLWFAAFVAQRRVAVTQRRLGFDAAFGIVVGVIVALREGPVEGLIVGLVVIPLMILFSAFRTIQMRYFERKTQTILDGTPGMRDAYDRHAIPSRRERKARRNGDGDGEGEGE